VSACRVPVLGLCVCLAACGSPTDGALDTGNTGGPTDSDTDRIDTDPMDTDWTCGPDDVVCDGVCRPVRFDEGACGACGTVCAAGQVCDEGVCTTPAQASPCDSDTVAEVLAPATAQAPTVSLDCSLALDSDDVVTRKLVLEGPEASGVTVDCGGGTLRTTLSAGGPDFVSIRSRKTGESTWARPTDITIRDCRIEGTVRIHGQGLNGEGEDVRTDSLTPGHRTRAQLAAPTRVLLDRLTLVSTGRIPLYVSPGATEVTLRDSLLTGRSVSTVVYLDAESGHNTLVDNTFDVEQVGSPLKREVIAVDGSADNVIARNTLSDATSGGVFIYRNCGEGGTVRHQRPRRNVITANTLDHGDGLSAPAVWIGSRGSSGLFPTFCPLDDGLDFGSSASDLDFAEHQVIVRNALTGAVPDPAVRVGDEPSVLRDNRTPTATDTWVPVCALFREARPPILLDEGRTRDGRTCRAGRLVTE